MLREQKWINLCRVESKLIRDAPEQLGMMGYFSHESSLLTTVILSEKMVESFATEMLDDELLEQLDALDGICEAQDCIADNRSGWYLGFHEFPRRSSNVVPTPEVWKWYECFIARGYD